MEIIKHLGIFIFALLLLISLHEWGHYIVARRLGIGVRRFSIGFGKPLFTKIDQNGTQWCIAPLLLGGYVQLLDQREAPVPPERIHEAFDQQSIPKRTAVILAGPLMNFLLGLVLFWLSISLGIEQTKSVIQHVIPHSTAATAGLHNHDRILSLNQTPTPSWPKFMLELLQHSGESKNIPITVSRNGQIFSTKLDLSTWHLGTLKPHPLRNLGLEPVRPIIQPIVNSIRPNSPAEKAGLKPQDTILTLDREPIDDWYELTEMIHDRANQTIAMTILRDQKIIAIHAKTSSRYASNFRQYGYLGIEPKIIDLPKHLKYVPNTNVLTAWKPALIDTIAFSQFHFIILGKLMTGKISVQSLGGPIAIYHFANIAMQQGIAHFCSFLAILSIMLACINLFPIPGLDGGHLVFLGYEAIRGKPLSIAIQGLFLRTGLIIIILIMVHATINDLLRQFA